ncbi:hypothetical protein [Actinomyces naeslundii]|uniref:hypothetical protein n=1 Tax=Actinomyces naeslundii TaxID=1655 RepID=UPI00096D93C8|nr:hypothetical protein [Actinomyces naeslundii]OMG17416.1 hypothetical protein BKH38_10085 [Actinomyces naeslundii]
MRQLVPIPIPSEKGVLVHTPPSLPAGLRQRLLSVAIALPLLTVGAVAAPVSAAVPTATPDTGITVEGRYHPAGAGCHGSDNADGCLSWGVRVPSTVAPNSSTTVTIEADSVPGQWTWSCPSPDGDRVAGTSAFYIDKGKDEPASKLADSGLGFFDHLYYNQKGDSAGSVTAVSCTPEHLSLTYEVNFDAAWDQSSYLDLDLGTTVVAPGADARSYTFSPKITTSAGSLVLTPTATAQKPAASEAHATVSVEDVRVDGAAKDASRFTMTARNDSATPLSDFTISASRSRGQAQVTALTCDLTAFGGEVVSAKGPAENLTVSSGTAKVPQGKDITCQVDLTGVVGRNRVKAALTTGNQTFSSDYTKDRPISEVKVQPTDRGVEADPTGTYEVEVGYSVTFTNNTDADGQTSNIVLHPRVPAGFTLKYVWGSGVPWWISMDDYAIQPDGSVPLSTEDTLHANSSTTMTFTTFYEVNAEAVTEDTWKALGTCDPKDPSKGLTTQIDVVGSDGVEPGTYSTCTTVTRTKN